MQKSTHTHTHTHTHGCLCKIIIPIIATFAITIPSFANIDKNAQSATCDSSTIGTTTGPANLQADWTANTINLDFYSNDTKVGTGSCSYDGGITLPNTPEVPTGYTFGGWKLRAAAAPQQCSLSGLDTSINGSLGYSHVWYNSADYCAYGRQTVSCSEDIVNDLLLNEWKTIFSYGVIKGKALCSSTNGAETNIPDETNSGQFCWCKVTDFIPYDNHKCNYSSSSWGAGSDIGVLAAPYGLSHDCDKNCAQACALMIKGSENKRFDLFTISGDGSVAANDVYQESTGGTVVELIGYQNKLKCRTGVSYVAEITPSAAGTLVDSASTTTTQIIKTAGSNGEAQEIKSFLDVFCGIGNVIITE